MTTLPEVGFRRRLALHGEDWLLLGMLALVFAFALAGAFAHMKDWTVTATNEALRAYADRRGLAEAPTTDAWFGWANAVTSEIMPTASLLYIRKRQRQGRGIGAPVGLYIGSMIVSLLGQLSSVGVRVPYDFVLLACLPIIALTVLSIIKFADLSYARQAAEAAEQQAAVERRRAERAAELQRKQDAEAAELAAERERADRREAAELAARLERERIAAEQAGLTERERIAAEERREAREADERRRREEADAERQIRAAAALREAEGRAEAARIEAEGRAARARAEAARIEAEAEARKLAASRVAAATAPTTNGGDDEATNVRRRRPRHETLQLVNDVLITLPAGTTRDAAVQAVAAALDITPRYVREFIPEGWTAPSSVDLERGGELGSASGRRHLAVVAR